MEEQQPETSPEAGTVTKHEPAEPASIHVDIAQSDADSPPAAGPASPLPTATPKVIASLRKNDIGMRSTSNKENMEPAVASTPALLQGATLTPRSASNYDALEAAVVQAATPPSVSRRTSAAEIQPAEEFAKPEEVASLEQPADTPLASPSAPEQDVMSPSDKKGPEVSPEPAKQESALTEQTTEHDLPLAPAVQDTIASPEPKQEHSLPLEATVNLPAESSPAPEEPDESQPVGRETVASTNPADPIFAMDALDEALEKVKAEVQHVDSSTKPKGRKAAPVVRTTKASQARMSLAQGDKGSAPKAAPAARPRPSTISGAPSNVRQSIVSKSTSGSTKRFPSGAQKPGADSGPKTEGEKKEAVIPHSKPRPVTLSFPTPPPPPKSKKAPTTTTFQLPGEAVAAKLKAAREERMKKQAEENENKAAFKARPAPVLKKTPSVRQTAASKARESNVTGKPPAPAPGLKGARGVNTASSASIKPRVPSNFHTSKPTEPNDLKVAKRPNATKPRTSLSGTKPTITNSGPRPSTTGPATTSTAAPGQRIPSKGTAKGREVFSRAALAKETAEKEKREKEEAARKARLAAAERGRQASREWAEKQKMKKLGIKPDAQRPAPNAKETAAAPSAAEAPQMEQMAAETLTGSAAETTA